MKGMTRPRPALAAFFLLASSSSLVWAQETAVCTGTSVICSPAAGDTWTQNDRMFTVVWNPSMVAPFEKSTPVDMYLIDDPSVVNGTSYIMGKTVDLSIGVVVIAVDNAMFPDTLPINRSSHLIWISADSNINDPVAHRTLNSSSFNMVRTEMTVNGTLIPIPSTGSVTSSVASTSTSISAIAPSATTHVSSPPGTGGNSTPLPAPVDQNHNGSGTVMSPLVIGLISAGGVALVVAALALMLVYRTRQRFLGKSGNFRNLSEQPGNHNHQDGQDESVFKLAADHDDDDAEIKKNVASFVGPALGGMAAARNSSNTIRSTSPMINRGGNQTLLSYNNSQANAPPMPLMERNSAPILIPSSPSEPSSPSSPLQNAVFTSSSSVPSEAAIASGSTVVGGAASNSGTTKASTSGPTSAPSITLAPPRRPSMETALSTGDARLIADTFRKSLRRPNWASDDDEDREDHGAAHDFLRRELTEQGVDMQRGVQRRVTIQDRAPISVNTLDMHPTPSIVPAVPPAMSSAPIPNNHSHGNK